MDCTRPDSAAGRVFAAFVETLVFAPTVNETCARDVAGQLREWDINQEMLKVLLVRSPRLKEAVPLVAALSSAGAVGREAVQSLQAGHAPAAGWLQAQLTKLDQAAQPHAACELPVIAVVKLLVAAAAEQDQHAKLSAEAWKQHLLSIVNPPSKVTAAH